MLEDWYNKRFEEIDKYIKRGIENVSKNLNEITQEEQKENFDLINKLEENYNIKLASVCKEMYIQGFKDGINLILESKDEDYPQKH
jgi:hypothetical protein